jgi:uncharacterized protein (TIGR00369 family)
METTDSRTRIVTWGDPMLGPRAAPTMSGLEYMQALIRGEYPPPSMAETLNFRLIEVAEGRAVFRAETGDYLYNPIGTVHGGFACTLLDSAMGTAIYSTLAKGVGWTTLELHTNFVRPIMGDTGVLLCEGEVIHRGRRMATAQARLVDESGKLYAHGTTTAMIFTPEDK